MMSRILEFLPPARSWWWWRCTPERECHRPKAGVNCTQTAPLWPTACRAGRCSNMGPSFRGLQRRLQATPATIAGARPQLCQGAGWNAGLDPGSQSVCHIAPSFRQSRLRGLVPCQPLSGSLSPDIALSHQYLPALQGCAPSKLGKTRLSVKPFMKLVW